MKKLLAFLVFALCPLAAQAQTPGAQPEFCVTSPSQTANYNQLCIAASSSGGFIGVTNFGTATGGLTMTVNPLQFLGFGLPAIIEGFRANGTSAAPTAVSGGQFITEFLAGGYDGAAYASSGGLLFSSNETWTPAAHGTGFRFQATKTGTLTTLTPGDFNSSNAGDWTFTAPMLITPPAGSTLALSIAPPASSLATGIVISQSVAGSSGFPAGNAMNLLFVGSDNAVLTGAASFLNLFEISYTCCGPLAQGGRQGLSSFVSINGADSPSNQNKNWIALVGSAQASVNVGGTNTDGGSLGTLAGANNISWLANGATDWAELTGEAINVALLTGSSVNRKSILHLAYFCPGGCDAVQGVVDGAIIIGAATGVTTVAKNGILISNTDGVFPLGTGSTVLALVGSGALTMTNGIDFSSLTGFSGCGFKSTNVCIGATAGAITATLSNSNGNTWLLGAGATKGIRLYSTTSASIIEGVDQTGSASYQPITLGGSALLFTASGSAVGDYASTTAGTWTFSQPTTISNAVIKMTALPGSAGAGGLFLCVDTSGVVYKKATCP